MGCKGSKLDDQKAVALCRGRSDLLAAAVRHRYALADSHAAVSNSLLSFSDSLHQLLFHVTDSPTIPLPPPRKPNPSPPPHHHSHSRSHSGSHLHFHPSGSDSDHSDDRESARSSPLHYQPDHISYPYPYLPMYNNHDDINVQQPVFGDINNGNTYYHMYYAKSRPPPASVTVQQQPPSSETGYTSYGYNNLYSFGNDDGGANGFFGGGGYPTYTPGSSRNVGGTTRPGSSARSVQPPPSPPRVSTWDFLNPFEINYDNFNVYGNNYYAYTPSRSSREVREEEGIPDLEEESSHEVVKEAYGDEKSVASSSTQEIGRASTGERSNLVYQQRFEPMRSDAQEAVQQMVDKEVVSNEVRRSNVVTQRRATGCEVTDLMDEIKIQFQRASEAASQLGALLEVGQRRFQPRSSVYQVSSRMASAMAPLSLSTGDDLLNLEENKTGSSGGLCMTLQKLYIWEKKLYNEVKAEEKMRLMLAKNTKKLRLLDERGAEPQKIDATRKLVRKLSTKIRIAIQVVNSISHKINKVRDDELCPQLIALIQGFARMWREILDCHEIQCQIISEAKKLDFVISNRRLSNDATMQLELELMKWSVNFSSWVNTQKSYVKALNGWLSMCLNPESELTEDGPAPYSPGRTGAPPIFVICNIWSQAMDKLSDYEVVGSMRSLAGDVKQLSEGHILDQTEHMVLVRERERWGREMERKVHEINKEVDMLNKKLVLVPGQNLLVSGGSIHVPQHGTETGSLHVGLKHLLESLKNFAANSLQVYEELHMHAEREACNGRKNAKVP